MSGVWARDVKRTGKSMEYYRRILAVYGEAHGMMIRC